MPKGRLIQAGAIKRTRIGTGEVEVVDECGGAMADDAETRARGFLGDVGCVLRPGLREKWIDLNAPDLAALLRAERERTLAEVRRVVEEERGQFEDEPESNGWLSACDRILARLEKM